jgi:DTW domain-containing protein YfiP
MAAAKMEVAEAEARDAAAAAAAAAPAAAPAAAAQQGHRRKWRSLEEQAEFWVAQARSDTKCARCWLKRERCVCGELRPVGGIRHEFSLYMHFREAAEMRGTNTAKLLALTTDAPIFIGGVRRDEEALLARIRQRAARTCVLFPSPDALTVPEMLARARGAASRDAAAAAPSEAASAEPPPLHVVVVDGTWGGAKMLCKRLSTLLGAGGDVPRVRLTASSRRDFQPLRKTTVDERVSTMGAVVHLLRELAAPAEAVEGLARALNAYIDRFREQTNFKPLPAPQARGRKRRREGGGEGEEGKEEAEAAAEAAAAPS